MYHPTPSELPVGGVYVPPALVVGLLGLAATWLATKLLNRTHLSRFFWHPPLAFLAMWVLMSAIIGFFFVAP